MSLETVCRKLIDEYRSRTTVRAGSLITTVFGDAIAPRGGVVWLGSLIHALEDFGISERLVRTSVFRLAKEGWLQSELIGRRSYYSLTDSGRERFEQATHRIYGDPVREWDGRWCLLLLGGLDAESRERVKKECGWLGFAAMSANVLAHPSPDMPDVDATLTRIGVGEDVVIMSGQAMRGEPALRELARSSWNLDEIDERYITFVRKFRPVYRALQKSRSIKPRTAFLLRTLLIQEYRKILLRDPHLPLELLPPNWHGTAAYQLCRNLYCRLYEPADEHLSSILENADGPLPPAVASTRSRFGGLEVGGKEQFA